MPSPAAVKQSHGCSAKWTPWPYCSHSAHLLHPLLSSQPSLSLFICSLCENGHWETILFHKSNHIILSFSISTLSPLPSTSSPLYHSPISSPLPSPAWSSLVPSLRKAHLMWVKGWGIFPFSRCNPIRSAGDAGLKRHRLILSLIWTFLTSAAPFVAGAMCKREARLITAASGIVELSPS